MDELNRKILTYLVNFLFKSLLKHLVSLVKNHRLDVGEIDVSSLNVIQDSTTSSNEEVNSSSKSSCLVIDVDSSIYCQTLELILVVLQL